MSSEKHAYEQTAHSEAAEAGDVPALDYDVIVIGSGFGGSVSALRLTEKGYRVGVLEAGRRFTNETLPKNSWDLRSYLWAPALGFYGIQRIHLLGKVMVLAGAGVGGGSLNYANTLYVPPAAFFRDPQWGHITDWAQELKPYYDQAQRMLGVRPTRTMTPCDVHLQDVAEKMGVGDTFRMASVGVFFGDGEDAGGAVRVDPGQSAPDPYFGGVGPSRKACTECGECMTGCRYGAKNTLNENYLHLAEKSGAVVHAMTTAVAVAEEPGGGGYRVTTVPTDQRRKGRQTVLRARQVVIAAGTYGTQTLLHRMRATGLLPRISPKLGELTRTNSEALVGATTSDRLYRRKHSGPKVDFGKRVDFSRGVAITSSIHPDETTHIEAVRYGKGSNAMAPLSILQIPYGGRLPRWVQFIGANLRRPGDAVRMINYRRWSERTIVGLVMQTHDNSLTTCLRPKGLGKGLLTARQGHGEPNPDHIPEAAEGARLLARSINGTASSNVGELMGTPLTAHFLGGCPIGQDAEHGVIDPYHRLFGYPGISVVDGASVSANLGVNPALTITAQAERAMALWPNKDEQDFRPEQGRPYLRMAPVAPVCPAVPADAFGALRLTVMLPVPLVPPRRDRGAGPGEAGPAPSAQA
ncbi:GMC family oxidoreductase [Streptomyces avidinii]|uniref:GMC family oxidoreductase N-terminal domain-containing protein n=1 Tax=Streptomyces avidinii TaxID=1895 RepID=UPI00386470F9|nr:GMC family oxidoreductase [Streptomyces avidinii]WTA95641.1 GMC family oxidoreductase [Streptomyces avidinii]